LVQISITPAEIPTEIVAEDTQMAGPTEKHDLSKMLEVQSSISARDNISELSANVKMVALTDIDALNKLKEIESSDKHLFILA
jgi:hypothetical protein